MTRPVTRLGVLLMLALISTVSMAAGRFQLPSYSKQTLDNGLTVYLMEQHEVPLLAVNLVLDAGSVHDRIAGTANLTAEGLLLGTAKRSKEQIEQTFEFVGATIAAASGPDYASLRSKLMVRDADELLAVFAELAQRPSFDAAEFEKLKERKAQELIQAKESPRGVINSYFNTAVFGNAGYGIPPIGTEDSVASLQTSDLKSFYQAHYQPARAALILVGDFDTVAMEKRVRQLFGDWSGDGSKAKAPQVPSFAVNDSRVWLVDKPDATETTFVIGGQGIRRDNVDYVALSVINTVLGGRFTSWLNEELRINTGLTYGAGSRFTPLKHDGTFAISTFTKTETTGETIDLALKVYQRLWDDGIDEDTLRSAKNYVKGQFPPRYERSDSLARLLGDMFIYGFDETFINTFAEQVDALDISRIRYLVHKYFPRDKLQFVLIGNADEVRELAKSYGKVLEIDIERSGYGGDTQKVD